jgi:hypothetical protein
MCTWLYQWWYMCKYTRLLRIFLLIMFIRFHQIIVPVIRSIGMDRIVKHVNFLLYSIEIKIKFFFVRSYLQQSVCQWWNLWTNSTNMVCIILFHMENDQCLYLVLAQHSILVLFVQLVSVFFLLDSSFAWICFCFKAVCSSPCQNQATCTGMNIWVFRFFLFIHKLLFSTKSMYMLARI